MVSDLRSMASMCGHRNELVSKLKAGMLRNVGLCDIQHLDRKIPRKFAIFFRAEPIEDHRIPIDEQF